MWLLENEDVFGGRQLWLRPGKTYLFGRTASEPGQLEISHNTISRKHLTISVEDVEPGHAHDLSSRSRLTIEDLATKIGTTVDGRKIKGAKLTIDKNHAQVMMGKCPHVFRITWHSVVFTFSFTNKEMQTQPLTSLRDRFESLDIKLLTDYNIEQTTHVVSKKRNTAKGLQALINGRYIVTESFLDAVTAATTPSPAGDGNASPLEQDFRQHWPDALEHLPPRGGEPVQHPDGIYSPDEDRRAVFEGYTFIFYDQTQYNNLLAPITNGGGKAALKLVEPGDTETNDFVGFVKGIAGEQGLGSLQDGSEGRGVVLVRYLPAKGERLAWYTDFLTSVSLQLDHRPIEQSEFLEAILSKDASILRRSLDTEPADSRASRREVNQQPSTTRSSALRLEPEEEERPGISQKSVPRKGPRRPVKRRFAGFADEEEDSIIEAHVEATRPDRPIPQDEEGLFVSQEPALPQESQPSGRRNGSSNLLEGMAEGSERYKRQKIAHGITSGPPSPEPEEEHPQPQPKPKKASKKTYDVLQMAAERRQEEEARARAEEEDLANLPDDLDLAEIRKLNIVEEIPLRDSSEAMRNREQDVASTRWKPEWNGMQNFKKFRKRGAVSGRAPARVIVSLTQVKTKEFGVGDGYWLEDETSQNKDSGDSSHYKTSCYEPSRPSAGPGHQRRTEDDSDEEESHAIGGESLPDVAEIQPSVPVVQNARASPRKRPAAAPASASSSRPHKRPRAGQSRIEIRDSDESADSDDDLKFRFGRRR
ncbi:hypothetical protein LIA77_05206 [Sarocladium implicatum]|nr:hypothetical protein LIA77_05206 [Sarocladium implicatum]